MRSIVLGSVLALGLCASVSAEATPKPLLVWVYGDGESARMLSEFAPTTGITALRKSPMESTSPFSFDSNQTLAARLLRDLQNAPAGSVPNLVHIGYNAADWSFYYCGYAALNNIAQATWEHDVQAYASSEANAINDAVTLADYLHLRVLISKGPGVPAANASHTPPLEARTMQQQITDLCMADAFFWVSWDLAALTTAYWVDFSGMTVDSRLGGAPVVAWQLDVGNVWHWEQDGVHVSTDRLKFDGKDPPQSPIVPYSQSFSVGTGTNQVPRSYLGAYRVAQNVLRAYQSIQSML